jgi:hypothetical protein
VIGEANVVDVPFKWLNPLEVDPIQPEWKAEELDGGSAVGRRRVKTVFP